MAEPPELTVGQAEKLKNIFGILQTLIAVPITGLENQPDKNNKMYFVRYKILLI
jgi:hypothetical protein